MVKQENDSVFAEVLDSVGQNMVITENQRINQIVEIKWVYTKWHSEVIKLWSDRSKN